MFVTLLAIGQQKNTTSAMNNGNAKVKTGSFSVGSKTLHDFTVKDINGKSFDLASLKGKKVLVEIGRAHV